MKKTTLILPLLLMTFGFILISPRAAFADYSLDEYTQEVDLGDGYSYKVTLKIGGWVKASDEDMISTAWNVIGGDGDAPAAEDFYDATEEQVYDLWDMITQYAPETETEEKKDINDLWNMITGQGDDSETEETHDVSTSFHTNTSIMCFANMSFYDETPGDFLIADSSKHISCVINAPWNTYTYDTDSCIYYSSETKHLEDKGTGYNIAVVTPHMEGSAWGPVSIVICVDNALTPEYPEGAPEIVDYPLSFHGQDVYVDPTWE